MAVIRVCVYYISVLVASAPATPMGAASSVPSLPVANAATVSLVHPLLTHCQCPQFCSISDRPPPSEIE